MRLNDWLAMCFIPIQRIYLYSCSITYAVSVVCWRSNFFTLILYFRYRYISSVCANENRTTYLLGAFFLFLDFHSVAPRNTFYCLSFYSVLFFSVQYSGNALNKFDTVSAAVYYISLSPEINWFSYNTYKYKTMELPSIAALRNG